MNIFALDEFILAHIIEHLGGPYFAGPLRETCRAMRARIRAPQHCTMHDLLTNGAWRGSRAECALVLDMVVKSKRESQYIVWYLDRMAQSSVYGATRAHCASSFPMIAFALERGVCPTDIMNYAASAGNDKLCTEMREMIERSREPFAHWFIGIDSNEILARAAYSGHISTCKLAISWGACDYEMMLREGAHGGNIAICKFATSLGARDFDGILREASSLWLLPIIQRKVNEVAVELCEFARELGARNFEDMLQNAASQGLIVLCNLAMSWGARDYDAMLRAVAKNHTKSAREIMQLAISSGARDIEGLFARAICECNFEIAWYATRDFGAHDFRRAINEYSLMPYESRARILNVFAAIRDIMEAVHHEDPGIWDIMLAIAARRSHCDLCELAHEWGARDYSPMIREDYMRNARELRDLAQQWEVEETSRPQPSQPSQFVCVIL
jgi:hypothetical protein